MNYDFPTYLASKRSVDDRALNRSVWDALARSIAERQAALTRPLRVLEVASGIGTMVERVIDWQLFSGPPGRFDYTVDYTVDYTAIDSLPANIAAAEQRLHSLPPFLCLHLATADVFEFCTRAAEQESYDLLIAHAFLDLLDTPSALPQLRKLLRPGGLFYFTINFDGATILQPEIDPALDAQIEAAYHRTMDERITDGRRSGDSRTGRHLFGRLPAAGYHVEAAGSSDWVVHPVAGSYPTGEAYFLHFIVNTMHGALCRDPAFAAAPGREAFDRWIAARHDQIDRAELTYIAHQLDFMGHI